MTANWIAGKLRWWSVGAVGVLVILAAPTVGRGQPVNASAETVATTPPPPDPLVAVCISERLVRRFSQPLRELTPVDERIVEVRFRGQARTVGVVSLEFSPAENDAAVTITIGGTTLSTTTGRRNGAVVHGKATTKFSVAKTILLSMDRGFSTMPTRIISTSTDTKVESVGATVGGARGIVAKQVAAKKSEQLKSQADAEAHERAELLLSAAIDEIIQAAVDKLNDGFFVIEPAIREYRRAAGQVFHIRTTETHFQISARHADATGTPQLPAEAAEPHLVQVWIHGSLFNQEDRESLLRQWPDIKQSLGRNVAAAVREGRLAESEEVELPVEIQQIADWVRIAVDVEPGF
jgi:hypothetical protein